MGRNTFTRAAYSTAYTSNVPSNGRATRAAEEIARRTGRLKPEVDPAGYEGGRYKARPSRLRMEPHPVHAGLYELTDGTSMPVEVLLDTTGSMGDNVEMAIRALADSYEWCSSVLPGCHLHMCTGTFGDIEVDQFPYCRTQFEMEAGKMVGQLTKLVADNGGGGNRKEDPQYGLFAATYLTDFYVDKIGLGGYHFTVSDEPASDRLELSWLKRIFGDDVFEKIAENGYELSPHRLPTTPEMLNLLFARTHAFFLYVGNSQSCRDYWLERYGLDRFIALPDVNLLPQVQATIIGLTEGTLGLTDVSSFLSDHEVSQADARYIGDAVANIPLGVQAGRENFARRPQKGDVFRNKTDLWPISAEERAQLGLATATTDDGPTWL